MGPLDSTSLMIRKSAIVVTGRDGALLHRARGRRRLLGAPLLVVPRARRRRRLAAGRLSPPDPEDRPRGIDRRGRAVRPRPGRRGGVDPPPRRPQLGARGARVLLALRARPARGAGRPPVGDDAPVGGAPRGGDGAAAPG